MTSRALLCWFWLAVWALGLLHAPVWADGKAISPVAVATDLRMPDQRAILAWNDGTETLAIETRVEGATTEFAWVVPMPAVPRVQAGTGGLFETMDYLTRPEVVHRGGQVFGAALAFVGFGWLTFLGRRRQPIRRVDVLCAPLTALGLLLWIDEGMVGVLLALITLATFGWGLARIHAGRPGLLDALLVAIILFVLSGMLLPALSGAGGSSAATAGPGVEVLARQHAGVFETTTVASKDPAALAGWLRTNGFRLPKAVEPVLANHVRDGWVFVASRVRPDLATSGVVTVHPLIFTFPSKEPVYPLRLTGVGNGPLSVELFVLGPERAAVDGFTVRDARPAEQPWWGDRHLERLDPNVLQMVHPGLKALAPEAAFATRLAATLTPEQMLKDATVRWEGAVGHRSRLFSRRGALLHVLDRVGTGLLVVLALVGFAGLRWSFLSRRLPVVRLGACVLALGFGGVLYGLLPVTAIRLEHRLERILLKSRLEKALRVSLDASFPTNAAPEVDAVRAVVRRTLATDPHLSRVRESDSPRNVVVRQTADGVRVNYVDDFGREDPLDVLWR